MYFWWWEYLRRSEIYRKALSGVPKTERIKKLIEDFGDIHSQSFKSWWKEHQRGARLFATLGQKRVELKGVVTDESGVKHLEISIPLSLPRKHIEHRIKTLLDKHHTGKKGYQNARVQLAAYTVSRAPNITALETGLAVYDARMQYPHLPMWKIAVLAIRKYKPYREKINDPKFKLDYDQRRQAAVEVHRYLKKTLKSIENVNKGVFP